MDILVQMLQELRGKVESGLDVEMPWMIYSTPLYIDQDDVNSILFLEALFQYCESDILVIQRALADLAIWTPLITAVPTMASAETPLFGDESISVLDARRLAANAVGDDDLDGFGLLLLVRSATWWLGIFTRSIIGNGEVVKWIDSLDEEEEE